MNREKNRSFLELKVIWRDENMFEVSVTASNKRYFGITDLYNTSNSLKTFAQSLESYPNDNNILFYEVGEKDGYAYFSMRFYRIDNAGHIGVQIHLEDNVATEYREEEKNKITLELLVEPNAIDNFQRELLTLAEKQEGIATLFGRDN